MFEISIIIPVYNSAPCLPELNRQIEDALSDVPYEAVFINDRSRDQSWDKIIEITERNKNITAIDLRKNSGQDNAIMAGLRQAAGRYIVIMDDDLQHSPYDIKKMHEKCVSGNYDVCFANFPEKENARWKIIGSWINGKAAEFLLSKPRDIYLSPFKIIKNAVIQEIIKYDGPYPYIDGLILAVTDNFTQINIAHYKRPYGKGNYNLIKSIAVFMKLATSFSVIPLRLSAFIGFISSILGFLLGCYYAVTHLTSNQNIEGWTTLVVIILFIGGLMLVSLGIIGEYLGRAYLRLNNRPQYTIKEIIKNTESVRA